MMNESVLIVDEDANAGIITAHLLRLRGFRARAVADADTAGAHLENENVAVVLVGIDCPEASGLDCLRRVRAGLDSIHAGAGANASPTPHVIALTRRQEPEVERFVRRMGADLLLRRPVDPPDLIRAVEYFAAHHTPALRRA